MQDCLVKLDCYFHGRPSISARVCTSDKALRGCSNNGLAYENVWPRYPRRISPLCSVFVMQGGNIKCIISGPQRYWPYHSESYWSVMRLQNSPNTCMEIFGE